MLRKAFFEGQFYPSSDEEIKKMFEIFSSKDSFTLRKKPKAIIVPHAGYIYSGFTANTIYKELSKFDYNRAVVIGPSHRVAFNSVSCYEFEGYETPFGALEFDRELFLDLVKNFNIQQLDLAHEEHSTETQFPFIKHYLKSIKIIELVYSRCNFNNLSKIIDHIYEFDQETLVVISTDLSHFYTLEKANKLDNICIKAIKELDLEMFDDGCEACGIIGIKAITKSAKELGFKPNIVDYRTSADTSGDKSRVVGYLSVSLM